jgi:hypothetical protein
MAHAQGVAVEFFPCDAERPIDLASPALRDVLLTYGIVPDAEAKDGVLPQIMGQIREKAPKVLAFGVRLTNNASVAIPVTPQTVNLVEGTWKDAGPDFAKGKPLPASDITAWAGARSLLAKGESLAPKQSVAGVVYFEISADAAKGAEPPRRVVYVAPQGVAAKAGDPVLVAALLDDLGLEWVATTSAGAPPAPPAGKPRIFPAAGNTDDNTPLVLAKPAAMVWQTTVVVAHKNIVGEQTQQAAGGMGGGMMGQGMMGGGMGQGQGMNPGMRGGGGGGQGGGATLPGMGGAPGAKPAGPAPRPPAAGGVKPAPAKPGGTPAAPAGGKRPRKPVAN